MTPPLTPSDVVGIITSDRCERPFRANPPLAPLRLQPPQRVASLSPEAAMLAVERPWDRPGRPSAADSEARTRELLRHLAGGCSLVAAADLARVKPARVLRLLEDPDFFAAFLELRSPAIHTAAA